MNASSEGAFLYQNIYIKDHIFALKNRINLIILDSVTGAIGGGGDNYGHKTKAKRKADQ